MHIDIETTDAAILAELGSRLRRIRLERNLSQAQLAKEAGVGRITLQRIEDGGSPSLTNLIRLLRALDLLDGIERLIPETAPSPMDQLRRRGRERQRAGGRRRQGVDEADSPSPWRWGDEDREDET